MKMGMCSYVCSKVGWLAHPVPGHGKKSGYAPDHTCVLRLQLQDTFLVTGFVKLCICFVSVTSGHVNLLTLDTNIVTVIFEMFTKSLSHLHTFIH